MSYRKHGTAVGARYRRRSIVQVVDNATAQAWVIDARRRGAADGAAGIWRPGQVMGNWLAAYSEAHAAARQRTLQAV